MARFSLDGADEIEAQEDGSGPSNPRQPHKKQRLTTTTTPAPPPQPQVVLSPEPGDTSGSHEEEEESEDSERFDEEEESDAEQEEEEEEENLREGIIEYLLNQSNQQPVVNNEISNERKITLTLTDPDVLDCHICFEYLKSPVFQCENGHIACASCCLKINNKCPTCSWPIGYNRCRAIEKVLEAVEVSCGNMMYGCKDMMKYCDKREHEYSCIYSPCLCPIYTCDFVDSASNFYTHFRSKHTATNFLFNCRFTVYLERNKCYQFLQEETLGTLFVLNQFRIHQQLGASVVLIAPKSSTGKYCYELEARDGETSLTLHSPVECFTKLTDYSPTKHVLVVEDFHSPLGVKLDLRILRRHIN